MYEIFKKNADKVPLAAHTYIYIHSFIKCSGNQPIEVSPERQLEGMKEQFLSSKSNREGVITLLST